MLGKMILSGWMLSLALPTWAGALYAQNAQDVLIYSDKPFVGGQKIASLPKNTAQTMPKLAKNHSKSSAKAHHVPAHTQQRRDAQRQAILQDELAQEHAALERAQASLKFTPKNELARVQANIHTHRQNISAIREEISRWR